MYVELGHSCACVQFEREHAILRDQGILEWGNFHLLGSTILPTESWIRAQGSDFKQHCFVYLLSFLLKWGSKILVSISEQKLNRNPTVDLFSKSISA